MRHHPLLARDRRYFKLIGGANFTDYERLRYLAGLYAWAGADLLDVAATPEAVTAALEGIQDAQAQGSDNAPTVMVSVTASDDPHCRLAVQDLTRCSGVCPHCRDACPHDAIDRELRIVPDRCVGCDLCVSACPYEAIAMVHAPFNPSLDQLWELGARGLELHTGSGDRAELAAWRESCTAWVARGGLFAVSVNPVQQPAEEAIAIAREVVAWFPHDRIVVQADGKPISGGAGRESAAHAVLFASTLMAAGVEAAVQPAGGANDQTGWLASEAGVAIAGVGMGSVARGIIRGDATAAEALRARRAGHVGDGEVLADLERARRLVHSVRRERSEA